MTASATLRSNLIRHAGGEGGRWLIEAVDLAAQSDRQQLLKLYTGASRTLGRLPFSMDDPAVLSLPEAAGLSIDRWTAEDAGRLALLLAHAEAVDPETFAQDAIACYEQGDTREQQSWLKAVVLLPTPERYMSLVIDACRTNILPQFEAVACENPYPSRYFPDRNFNQVVMKALFNGVRLERIVGLAARVNTDLARMANDFAAERTAAGRPVPADIGLATDGAAA